MGELGKGTCWVEVGEVGEEAGGVSGTHGGKRDGRDGRETRAMVGANIMRVARR